MLRMASIPEKTSSSRLTERTCRQSAKLRTAAHVSSQQHQSSTAGAALLPAALKRRSTDRMQILRAAVASTSSNLQCCQAALHHTHASHRCHSRLQAGSFIGLMGQVLQQMTATAGVPQGAALTVDNIKYHPAGKHACVREPDLARLACAHLATLCCFHLSVDHTEHVHPSAALHL